MGQRQKARRCHEWPAPAARCGCSGAAQAAGPHLHTHGHAPGEVDVREPRAGARGGRHARVAHALAAAEVEDLQARAPRRERLQQLVGDVQVPVQLQAAQRRPRQRRDGRVCDPGGRRRVARCSRARALQTGCAAGCRQGTCICWQQGSGGTGLRRAAGRRAARRRAAGGAPAGGAHFWQPFRFSASRAATASGSSSASVTPAANSRWSSWMDASRRGCDAAYRSARPGAWLLPRLSARHSDGSSRERCQSACQSCAGSDARESCTSVPALTAGGGDWQPAQAPRRRGALPAYVDACVIEPSSGRPVF